MYQTQCVRGYITLCCTLNQNLRLKLCSLQQSEPVTTPDTPNTLLMTWWYCSEGLCPPWLWFINLICIWLFGTEFAIGQDLPIYENLWDTGISHHSPLHSVVNFDITPIHSKGDKIVSAVIIPRATSNLPQQPVHQKSTWSHLHKLNLADPNLDAQEELTFYWEYM